MCVLNVGTSALETKTSEQTTVSTLPTETTEGNDLFMILLLVLGTFLPPFLNICKDRPKYPLFICR